MSLIINIIKFILIDIIVFILKYLWKRRRLYLLSRKIPGNNGLPLIGELLRFRKVHRNHFMDAVFDAMDKTSTLTKIWFGPELILVTTDPETVHTVFNSPHCLDKPKLFYTGLGIPKSLIPLSGDLYSKHRKLFNKAFMPNILSQIQPIIDNMCKRFVMRMEAGLEKDVNIMLWVGACALETFGKAQLGYSTDSYGSLDHLLIDDSLDLAMQLLTKPWLHLLPESLFQMTSIGKKFKHVVEIGVLWENMAIKHYEEVKDNDYESVRNRVIDILMDPKSELSSIEIRDEFIIFALGSYDTSAKTISFLLLMMAMHKDIQQKLIAEVDRICGNDENFVVDGDFLKKFEYMEMVIKETLRLFPPGPNVARVAREEMKIGGYLVPKGASIMISLLRMQRDPKNWGADAHLFRPERFEDETWNQKAWAPFSGGKRLCIGYRYANMFMKTFLIHFFRNYQVDTSLKFDELKLIFGVTISIEQGWMMQVKKRKP